MNSRTKFSKKQLECGFGVRLEEQTSVVLQMMKTAEEMKRVGKRGNSCVPFQKGIIISCSSLLSLHSVLSKERGVEFILTSHLNQDALENFFSRIRALGGSNTHPTSVEENLSSSARTSLFDCDAEGLKYLTGYVASKFISKFPYLGQKSSELASPASTAPWIAALSRGSLVVPSSQFLAQVYEMETLFCSVHGNSISSSTNVIESLYQLCSTRFPELPPEVLKKFCRTRTFVRIRFLNSQLKLAEVNTLSYVIGN